jgi:hypothetical protein
MSKRGWRQLYSGEERSTRPLRIADDRRTGGPLSRMETDEAVRAVIFSREGKFFPFGFDPKGCFSST